MGLTPEEGPRRPFALETRRDIQHVPQEERPRQEDYERYLYLVSLFRELGYDPDACFRESPFRVVDVGFNALLLFADEALGELAWLLGEDPAEPKGWFQKGVLALEALWDEEAGLYRSLDLHTGERIPRDTSAGFLPLLLPLSSSRVGRLVATFRAWAGEARYLSPAPTLWRLTLSPGAIGGARSGLRLIGFWPGVLSATASWRRRPVCGRT